MSMISVGGEYLIALFEAIECANGDGFLSNIEVAESADRLALILNQRRFFEAADAQHFAVELQQHVSAGNTFVGSHATVSFGYSARISVDRFRGNIPRRFSGHRGIVFHSFHSQ